MENKPSLTESKEWYVLYETGYEGPFDFDEVVYLYNMNQIGSENYIWSKKISTWTTITQVEDFKNALLPEVNSPPYVLKILDSVMQTQKASRSYNFVDTSIQRPPNLQKKTSEVLKSEKNKNQIIYPLKNKIFMMISLASVGLAIFYFLFLKFDRKYIYLNDLSLTQNNILQSVFLEKFSAENQKVTFVIDQKNEDPPKLYVSTNAPENSFVDVEIKPLRKTLIAQIKFIKPMKFKILNSVLEPQLIRTVDGATPPTGKYEVSLKINNQVLDKKEVFIGLLNEANYLSELRKYKNQIKKQNINEIFELRQMLKTIETQSEILNQKFSKFYKINISKIKSDESISSWKNTSIEWLKFQNQVSSMINGWNLSESSEYFYVDEFFEVKNIETLVLGFHSELDQVITHKLDFDKNKTDNAFFEIQKKISRLNSSLDYLENTYDLNE